MKISKVNDMLVFTCDTATDESMIMNALKEYASLQYAKVQESKQSEGHWLYAEGVNQAITDVFLNPATEVAPVTAKAIA